MVAEKVCSLQVVQGTDSLRRALRLLFGFETPVPSPLLRELSSQILPLRLSFLVPHSCDALSETHLTTSRSPGRSARCKVFLLCHEPPRQGPLFLRLLLQARTPVR